MDGSHGIFRDTLSAEWSAVYIERMNTTKSADAARSLASCSIPLDISRGGRFLDKNRFRNSRLDLDFAAKFNT